MKKEKGTNTCSMIDQIEARDWEIQFQAEQSSKQKTKETEKMNDES